MMGPIRIKQRDEELGGGRDHRRAPVSVECPLHAKQISYMVPFLYFSNNPMKLQDEEVEAHSPTTCPRSIACLRQN